MPAEGKRPVKNDPGVGTKEKNQLEVSKAITYLNRDLEPFLITYSEQAHRSGIQSTQKPPQGDPLASLHHLEYLVLKMDPKWAKKQSLDIKLIRDVRSARNATQHYAHKFESSTYTQTCLSNIQRLGRAITKTPRKPPREAFQAQGYQSEPRPVQKPKPRPQPKPPQQGTGKNGQGNTAVSFVGIFIAGVVVGAFVDGTSLPDGLVAPATLGTWATGTIMMLMGKLDN